MKKYSKLLHDSGFSKQFPQKAEELIQGFTNGFDMGYRGPKKVQRRSPNLKFRIGDETDLWNKVMKEVKLLRYAGPYAEIPYRYYIQSPIGLVPKDGGKDTRLIFHLSYPRNGRKESVNSNIDPDECKVKYPDFSDAIKLCIEYGKYCHLSRSDMRSAFRNLATLRIQWCYLVMKARSPINKNWYYFVDKCLSFGGSKSCRIFQDFSDSIAHIVRWRLNLRRGVPNYLDDFLFIELLKQACNRQMETFLQICKTINFPFQKRRLSKLTRK